MKFNPILMQKVTEEKKRESEQEKLKEEAGIDTQDVVIKKKGVREYAVLMLRSAVYAAVIALIFFGLITVLNHASRQVIIDMLSQIFH